MSFTFRVVLLAVSLLSAGYTFRKIRKSQMLTYDAIFWVLFSLGTIVLSIVPEIAIKGSELLGIESSANFVFLAVLFVVIIKLFLLSIDISVLKTKLKFLVEEYAIKAHELDNQHNKKQEKSDN
jgi:hypothetical protein